VPEKIAYQSLISLQQKEYTRFFPIEGIENPRSLSLQLIADSFVLVNIKENTIKQIDIYNMNKLKMYIIYL